MRFLFFVVVAAVIGFVCFHLLFSLLLEVKKVIKERAMFIVCLGFVQSDDIIATPCYEDSVLVVLSVHSIVLYCVKSERKYQRSLPSYRLEHCFVNRIFLLFFPVYCSIHPCYL